MGYKSELLQTLDTRGYLHQATNAEGLDALAQAQSIIAYIGFDCTADSLHVGSLLPIMLLRRLQQCGHQPIVLLGGGTSKVGDPSGKDSARQLLDDAQIARNKQGIQQIFNRYLRFDGLKPAIVVDNDDWLASLRYIDFLREYGRHFSVNRMLAFDSVRLRLEREQNLSFLEFNYMILQAYDFVALHRQYGCVLQLGGSDQWGNIVNGVELARRVGVERELFGLTCPLLTTASGAKMGKTAQGAVWLSADKLSPYDFWQFWRNTEDSDVGRFLRLFTDLPLEQIVVWEALEGAAKNEAKIALANAVTALCHGVEAAAEAASTAEATFAAGGTGTALPVVEVAADVLAEGFTVADALLAAGLVASKSEARRLIKAGAVKIHNLPCHEELRQLTIADVLDHQIKLAAGKKKVCVVKIV